MNIFDLHCDTLLKLRNSNCNMFENSGHISEIKLVKGKYLAECFAIYIPCDIFADDAFFYFKEQYNIFEKMLKNSEYLRFASNRNDILFNNENGKVSCILTAENAEFLNNDLDNLNFVKKLGLRILGLIHNGENCIGFPNSDNIEINLKPLKSFGREVIDFLNSNEIFVDVSHLNYGGFKDVVNIYKKPIIATHSCCRSVFDHRRNLSDDQIIDIANSCGIIGINFYSLFLNGNNTTEIGDIIAHIKHLINIGGEDVVALGSDFDGIECELPFKDCSEINLLVDELIKNLGFFVTEKICFKNALKLF